MEESYPNSSDDQPKDLTIKTAKKLKPIPPPLNLTLEEMGKISPSLLKEYTMFATSPKSPLMQKHLPFRKRAHSIPVNLIKHNSEPSVLPTVDEDSVSMSSTNEESKSIPSSPCVKYQHLNYREVLPLSEKSHRSHLETISTSDLSRDNFVLDLSTNQTSALLSPAPSSIGSSREELSESVKYLNKFGNWGYPWPPPVWHCFQTGSRVKLSGRWTAVEELMSQPCEWPGDLRVERITPPSILTCSASLSNTEVTCEVTPCHPLLVRNRGWVTLCPDSFHKRYGLKCYSIQPGDIIIQPTSPLPLTSPDICDRIKRFSFPSVDDSPPSPAFLLSPPTTPTRKNQEASDKPKRPMNAFMLFAKRYRLELIQTNPGKDNRAISVILGEAWRMLPQEERDKYIQGARDLSEEQKLLYPDCWKRKRSHSTS